MAGHGYTIIDGYLYGHTGVVQKANIPEGVKTIGSQSFYQKYSLTARPGP